MKISYWRLFVKYIRIFPSALVGLIFFYASLNATETQFSSFPSLRGRVVDEVGILSSQTREEIATLSTILEQKTSIQLVVVVLKSLEGRAIEEYGVDLARHWKIGQQDKNNGILLILAPSEREVRIEVGYGLEGDLTDAVSKKIIEKTIIPLLKRNEPGQALLKGTEVIVQFFISPEEFKKYNEVPSREELNSAYVFLIILCVFLFLGRLSKRKGKGRFWGGGGFGGGGSGGLGGGFGGRGGGFGGGGASGKF